MTTAPLSADSATLDRAAARLTGGLNGWSSTAAPELGVEAVVMVDGPLGLVSRGLDERDTSSLLPSGNGTPSPSRPAPPAGSPSPDGATRRAAMSS